VKTTTNKQGDAMAKSNIHRSWLALAVLVTLLFAVDSQQRPVGAERTAAVAAVGRAVMERTASGSHSTTLTRE